jgi:hypothetical protein
MKLEERADSPVPLRTIWQWVVAALVGGGLLGAAAAHSLRWVTGPPDGLFWVVFLLPGLQLLVSFPAVAVLAIILFRKQFAGLIPRLKKGPGGTEFADEVAAAQEAGTVKGREVSASVALAGVANMAGAGDVQPAKINDVTVAPPAASASASAIPPEVVAEVAKLHSAVAANFRLLSQRIAPDKPAEQRLTEALRELATLQVSYVFEKIYRVITGSQISALLVLNTRTWGVTGNELREIYKQNPDTAKVLNWDTWWRYLTSTTGFVRYENGMAFITPLGELFLEYLLQQRYTETKPL